MKRDSSPSSCLLVHVPHASSTVPAELRAELKLDDEALQREILLMTDHHTDLIARNATRSSAICFPVSRLVVDPERFRDDDEEVMVGSGMGVIYTKTSDGRELRSGPNPAARRYLLNRFYDPHHLRLTEEVQSRLDTFGLAILLDLHSFPSEPLPYELDQRLDRPEVCLGSDLHHTPPELLEMAKELVRAKGYSVAVDRPFSGAMVPRSFLRKTNRVMSIMLELRRDLYMTELTAEPHEGLSRVIELAHTLAAEMERYER